MNPYVETMTVDLSGPIAPQPPSDSRTVLTIGDEQFPVVRRSPIPLEAEACPATVAEGESPHQLFVVETDVPGLVFVVCDDCSSSRRVTLPYP